MVDQQPTGRGRLVARLRRGGRAAPAADAPSGVADPCAACGETTTVGSPRYAERHAIARPSGATVFLCSECNAQARARPGHAPLTDEEFADLASDAGLAGVNLLGGGMG